MPIVIVNVIVSISFQSPIAQLPISGHAHARRVVGDVDPRHARLVRLDFNELGKVGQLARLQSHLLLARKREAECFGGLVGQLERDLGSSVAERGGGHLVGVEAVEGARVQLQRRVRVDEAEAKVAARG